MSDLNEFFQDDEQAPEHPMARTWGPLLETEGIAAHCEVKRQRDGISYRPAKIYVQFTASNPMQSKTEFDEWDLDLNTWLIKKHVKAITPENEQLRFALTLKDLLKKPEIRLGDGFFSAVLVEVLKTSGFGTRPEVAAILAKIGQSSPHKGRSYEESVRSIKEPLKKCASWLKRDLSYPQEQAEAILAGAIVAYLDDRFSISNRSLLGLD